MALIPRTRADVSRLLQAVPEPVRSHFVEQARPALVLVTKDTEDAAIAVGASKFGGLPDLPAGQGWPERPPYGNADSMAERHRKDAALMLRSAAEPGYWATTAQARSFADEHLAQADAAGRSFPLSFMVQLDLGTLALEPGFDPVLPNHGRLLVFYDWWLNPAPFEPQSHSGWRVLWDTTPLAQLARHPAPDALLALCTEHWTAVFPPECVESETVFCVVPPDGWVSAEIAAEPGAIRAVLEAAGQEDRPIGYQLAGWPLLLQDGLQQQCQMAGNGVYCGLSENWKTSEAVALLEKAGEWQLVLQIGAPIIEVGALYVMMRQTDIQNRAFDRAWVVYQCD